MSVRTVGFHAVLYSAQPASSVFVVVNRFKVRRAATGAVSAQVVKRKPVRNIAYDSLIDRSVNQNHPTQRVYTPVTLAGPMARIYPAEPHPFNFSEAGDHSAQHFL